jgi:hypothetical protein
MQGSRLPELSYISLWEQMRTENEVKVQKYQLIWNQRENWIQDT